MKINFLVWILLAVHWCTWAQILTITNAENHEPVALATVTSEGMRKSITTNSKGQADLGIFDEKDLLTLRAVGYKPLTVSYETLKEKGFSVQMAPGMVYLDEVVVSASKWNQKTSEIPQKVVTISPQAIGLQNPQTAADLLGLSGKVYIQKSQQGGGSPMIRGFATNRLLYTVDGVRMNTAIFRGGNIQNVISLDPFAMEHIEVLFGPGSVIYGSDAIGGVMGFQTLAPQFPLSEKTLATGSALTRFASANSEKTGHFDINLGWEKWASVTSISYSDYGDVKMGSKGPDEYLRPFYVERHDSMDVVVANNDQRVQKPSGYSQINMMQKLKFRPNQGWDIEYGFHYSETSPYARYDRHIRYKNNLPRYGQWHYGPQIWTMNNLSVDHNQQNIWYDQATVRFAYQFFKESRVNRDFNEPQREIRTEEVGAWSANLDLVKNIRIRHRLFYGAEWVHNDVTSTGINKNILTGTEEAGPSRYPQAIWQSLAVYLSDQFSLTEQMSLHAGLRFNQFLIDADFDTTFYPFPFTSAKINNSALTGSIGLVFRPNPTWVLKLGGATAFRSPNIDDIGKVFDSEPGTVTVPNPDLQAEYAYNTDLSVVKVFSDWLKLDFTAYFTLLDNALVRRDYSINGLDSIVYDGELVQVQALQNAARAQVFGVQAGVDIKLPLGFGLVSDINFQKGEEELDNGQTSPSRHASPWFGITRLSYTGGKLQMQLYAQYNGEKPYDQLPEEERRKTEIYAIDAQNNPYSPGWYTLNYKALYQISDHMAITAGLENITDQRYRPYSSGIAAPGRNFIFSLKVDI
jgi:hemoglobin/transferrin/lactoferrin receptor protein